MTVNYEEKFSRQRPIRFGGLRLILAIAITVFAFSHFLPEFGWKLGSGITFVVALICMFAFLRGGSGSENPFEWFREYHDNNVVSYILEVSLQPDDGKKRLKITYRYGGNDAQPIPGHALLEIPFGGWGHSPRITYFGIKDKTNSFVWYLSNSAVARDMLKLENPCWYHMQVNDYHYNSIRISVEDALTLAEEGFAYIPEAIHATLQARALQTEALTVNVEKLLNLDKKFKKALDSMKWTARQIVETRRFIDSAEAAAIKDLLEKEIKNLDPDYKPLPKKLA